MQPTPPQNLNPSQYLEEAKAHLETIERGLLDLSGTIQQPESIQEIYNAAQSLNTGAVTHEMETIQQIAQFLEDCFGVMRTASVVSDQHLKELLWRVFNPFKELVEMASKSQEPKEYRQEVEQEVLKGLKPTINEAKKYLKSCIVDDESTMGEFSLENGGFEGAINGEMSMPLTSPWDIDQEKETVATDLTIEESDSQEQAADSDHSIDVEGDLWEGEAIDLEISPTIDRSEEHLEFWNQPKPLSEDDLWSDKDTVIGDENGEDSPEEELSADENEGSSFWEALLTEEENIASDSSSTNEQPTTLELDATEVSAEKETINEESDDSEQWDDLFGELETPEESEESSDEELDDFFSGLEDSETGNEVDSLLTEDDELFGELETAEESEESSDEELDDFFSGLEDSETVSEADSLLTEDDDLFSEVESPEENDSDKEEELDDFFSDAEESETESESDSSQAEEDLFDELEETSQESKSSEEEELDDFFSSLEDSSTGSENEEDFSWLEQSFEPLEDLGAIFEEEEEPTIIQAEDDSLDFLEEYGEYETSIAHPFTEAEAVPGKTSISYYDPMENLEALIDSVAKVETQKPLNQLGLEDYIERSSAETAKASLPYYDSIENLEIVINAAATVEAEETLDVKALEAYIEQPAGQSEPVTASKKEEEDLPAPAGASGRSFEQNMKVPVRLMDHLNNLIGELVVNRNSLEGDQARLRRFLDNLLEQVQNLNDLGGRMQDLYERSLLENSLLAGKSQNGSRQTTTVGGGESENGSSSGDHGEYDPLEMDRFSGFHLLSQEMIESIVRVRESASDIEFLVDEVDEEARVFRQVTTQLQEGFTSARMVAFSQVSDRLPRAIRNVSLKLNKKVKLEVEGKDTLVDKMLLEQLYDPMTHLVNNAITHGIEYPEERKSLGKPETGIIKVQANHQGNQTIITISDDGAGLNPDKIRAKAIQKGLVSEAEANSLPDIDIFDYIFHPGFSTKDKADDFAGRGVGMDVVRSSLNKLRGSININSTRGKGTIFTIGLPLTLSINKALSCQLNQSSIAFPMDGVEDQFEATTEDIEVNQDGERFIRVPSSSTLLPFKHLSELLHYNRTLTRSNFYAEQPESNEISVVVLRSTGTVVAVQVDQVLGQEEIVIKQLSGPAPKPVGVSGATVKSDGSVMAIADVLEVIDLFYGRIRKDVMTSRQVQQEQAAEQEQGDAEPMVLIVDDSITVRELLSMTFSKSGYRVEQARDGKEAWEKLRAGLTCDMMFCDIEMPRMDGLELLSRLKEEERFADLPIGMLTSRGAERHRQMAERLGAKGYFTKPYIEEALLDAAKRMLNGENLLKAKTATGSSV